MLEAAFAGSAHSFRKGRAILHSIFAYGMRQQWCGRNPVVAVEVPSIEEKEIAPLPLADCRRLVEAAKTTPFRDCLPALGLMLFAGVCPGEVARLRWGDVCCDEGVLRHCRPAPAAAFTPRCPPCSSGIAMLTRYLNLPRLRRAEAAHFWQLLSDRPQRNRPAARVAQRGG